MLAILGSLPVVTAIVMMVVLKQNAGLSLFVAWALSAVLAIVFWGLAPEHTAAYTILGFLSALDVILIIFSAIFLLNVLIEISFVKTIGTGFNGISQDRRVQILIIAWLFGAFLEGAAGFGTPAAIAAPLLMGLGVPAFFAALASLIANGVPSLFGAAGTPTSTGFATVASGLELELGAENTALFFSQLNNTVGLLNIFTGSFVPFLMIAAIVSRDGRKRGIKDAVSVFPLCLFAGLAFSIPAWLVSFLGPELPTILGSLVGMLVFIIAVKKGFLIPKEVYRFMDDPVAQLNSQADETDISLVKAWSPYIIICIVLVLTRLPQLPFFSMIRSPFLTVALVDLFGFEGINWAWLPLNNPGLIPFLPVALAYLAVYAKRPGVASGVFIKTMKQLKNAVVALLFGVALVQIMRFTNYTTPGYIVPMTTAIASALAAMFGGIYPVISPIIGALGTFVSGSHTVSNIMFYGLQLEAAQMLGMPGSLMLVAQTFGGSMGNMVAVNNIVAVAATTNSAGQESKILLGAIVPMVIFSLSVSAGILILLALGGSWAA